MVLLKLKKSQLPLCSFFPDTNSIGQKYQLLLLLDTWVLESRLYCKISENCKQATSNNSNEFGDSSVIEKSVTIQDQDDSVQEWLDIGNGCLCCTVKDNGVTAIENLIENSKDKIDYILWRPQV